MAGVWRDLHWPEMRATDFVYLMTGWENSLRTAAELRHCASCSKTPVPLGSIVKRVLDCRLNGYDFSSHVHHGTHAICLI